MRDAIRQVSVLVGEYWLSPQLKKLPELSGALQPNVPEYRFFWLVGWCLSGYVLDGRTDVFESVNS